MGKIPEQNNPWAGSEPLLLLSCTRASFPVLTLRNWSFNHHNWAVTLFSSLFGKSSMKLHTVVQVHVCLFFGQKTYVSSLYTFIAFQSKSLLLFFIMISVCSRESATESFTSLSRIHNNYQHIYLQLTIVGYLLFSIIWSLLLRVHRANILLLYLTLKLAYIIEF